MRSAAILVALFSVTYLYGDDAMSHARRSYELQQTGDNQAAEKEIHAAIELEPKNALFHSALAGILKRTGHPDQAIAEWEAALNMNPAGEMKDKLLRNLEAAELDRGAELGAAGKFREGLELARRAEIRFPYSVRVLRMLGFFEAKERLNGDAVHSYQRALRLEPSSAEAALGLAIVQAASGAEAEAIQGLDLAMKRHPENAQFPQALADLLMAMPDASMADTERAAALFRRALVLDPRLEESHYQLGVLAMRKGLDAEALRHWEIAGKLDAADGRVHFGLARWHRQANRPEEAEREMRLFEQSRLAANGK